MSMHTPGPWFVGGETDHGEILICSDARPTICAVDPGAREWCTQANARLIAAAPKMLEALRRASLALAFASEQSEAMRDDYRAVSEAIAEATGGVA